MGMNYGNITKASFQADIKRKQSFFNRCKRRFKVAKTPGEKQFLKGEATRIVTELKQCSKKWQNFGFGGCMWITKNFTVTNFNAARSGIGRKNTTGKNKTRKTFGSKASGRKGVGRSFGKRTTTSRSKCRTGSRTRSNASRRTYVAW